MSVNSMLGRGQRVLLLIATSLIVGLSGCPMNPPKPDTDTESNAHLNLGELRDFAHTRHGLDFFFRDPVNRPDDAGPYSFIRQMVPALFGRKVRGHEELRLLADVLRETGGDRAKFMQMLLDRSSPYASEYAEYWSDTLLNRLRIQRDGDRGMAACFAEPSRISPTSGNPTQLATCLLSNNPTADCRGGTNFNMLDVVRSSVILDNLQATYRAYLFPMVSFTTSGAEVTPFNEQDEIGVTFQHVYTHRNLDCLGCHNSTFSVSGETDIHGNLSYWNRHAPVPGAFEVALFGAPSGRNPREVNTLFRTSIRGGAQGAWGMSNCGTFRALGAADADSRYPAGYSPPPAYLTKPLPANASVWEVEQLLRSGMTKLATVGLRRDRLFAPSTTPPSGCTDHCATVTMPPAITEPPTALNMLVAARCEGCHNPSVLSGGLNLRGSDWETRVVSKRVSASSTVCTAYQYRAVPGNAAQSCLAHVIDDNIMPIGGGLTAAEKQLFTDWINALPAGAGCDPASGSMCAPVTEATDNDAALAYLVAMNIVNETWEEVMGNPLTIPNYFPRNDSQREILQNLTESVFLARGWSLKSLLIAILASEHFNRRAPASSTIQYAHILQPHHKPFEVNDPRRPPEALAGWSPGGAAPSLDLTHVFTHMRSDSGRSRHLNAMSDAVFRYSADNLLSSTSHALGWTAATVAPSFDYPSTALRKGIGQFFSDVEPGFRGVSFQSLVSWEAAHGSCKPPGAGPDWINSVVSRAAGTAGGVKYRDVAITLRDWLLANGKIETLPATGVTLSEESLLNQLFGGTATTSVLDTTVPLGTAAQRTQLETQLRTVCGMMLEAPQFMLAGIADEELGPQPRVLECREGPCKFGDYCRRLESAVGAVFKADLACSDDCAVVVPRSPPPPDIFCARRICERLPEIVVDLPDCLRGPHPYDCFPQPPECNLGCSVIDCCGGPLPPIDKTGFFLGLADLGLVIRAENVSIVRPGDKSPHPLEKGMKLAVGDILTMPPGSHLRIDAPAGVFETPANGVPRDSKNGWQLKVTRNLSDEEKSLAKLSLPPQREWIERAIRTNPLEQQRRAQRIQFLLQPEDPARIKQREEAMRGPQGPDGGRPDR